MLFVGFLSGFAGFCIGLVLVGPGIAQTRPGYSRNLPADRAPSNPLDAEAKAEASEAAYVAAISANRVKPGTFSESDVELLYRTYTDEMLTGPTQPGSVLA
jgi:hypothetical protein